MIQAQNYGSTPYMRCEMTRRLRLSHLPAHGELAKVPQKAKLARANITIALPDVKLSRGVTQ